jgi:hypothetical protein
LPELTIAMPAASERAYVAAIVRIATRPRRIESSDARINEVKAPAL